MQRRVFTIGFFICQLLILNISLGSVSADGCDCASTLPVAPLYRSAWFEQPALREENMRVVINRLKSYFRRAPSLSEDLNVPVVINEGVGEVYVHGEDISTDGVTVVEGSIPISGSVTFSGPVRASGTVTIAGMCAPASGRSPLRIGQPLLPRSWSLPLPLKRTAAEVPPLPEVIPAPVTEILAIEEIPRIPFITLPPVVMPTIPAYVLPEVVLPATDVYELGAGIGEIVIIGEDMPVCGTTFVDGVVPTVGEVSFGGYIPAKGSVTVSSCF